MDFTQIRYFLAVANSLNFTKAAKTCAVSQPALSKAIRKLEESLGAILFERDSHRVELTEFGNTMRAHFERIADNLSKARSAANEATNATASSLNIGVMCTIGPQHFGEFIRQFNVIHPDIGITLHDVTAEVIQELLVSGSLDCIFCASTDKLDHRFNITPMHEEPMVVAFGKGHRFSNFDCVPLVEIAAESYLDRLHCEFREGFLDFTKSRGLRLKIAISSEREDWIIEMIKNGLGVSVLPKSSAIYNSLNYQPISDLQELRKLELVMTKHAMSSGALNKFNDLVASTVWNRDSL